MSNVFEFLGCLGGTLYVLATVLLIVKEIVKATNKYIKYKDAYEELKFRDEMKDFVNTVGFKTDREKKEIEAKISARNRNPNKS